MAKELLEYFNASMVEVSEDGEREVVRRAVLDFLQEPVI
jgi:esterase/lipase